MFSILSNFLLKLSLSIFSFSRYPLIPFKEQIHFNSDFSYLVPFIRLNFAKERIVWLCYFWETRGPSATCSSFFHNCYLRSLCFFSFKATNDCQKMILANLISQLLISLSFIAYLYSFSSVFLTFPFPCDSIHHCLFHLTEPSSSFELRTLLFSPSLPISPFPCVSRDIDKFTEKWKLHESQSYELATPILVHFPDVFGTFCFAADLAANRNAPVDVPRIATDRDVPRCRVFTCGGRNSRRRRFAGTTRGSGLWNIKTPRETGVTRSPSFSSKWIPAGSPWTGSSVPERTVLDNSGLPARNQLQTIVLPPRSRVCAFIKRVEVVARFYSAR